MARWKDSPNEFAIDVIEALWTEGTFHIEEYGGDFDEWRAECDELITEVNATEVKPVKHAHWIRGGADKWNEGIMNVMHCSNCKALFRYQGRKQNVNYCYKCGAKMDLLD